MDFVQLMQDRTGFVLLMQRAIQLRRGGCTNLTGLLSDSQRFDFSRLGELICWIVFVLYLHYKISYLITAPVFPSWVFSGFPYPKILSILMWLLLYVSQYLFSVALLVKKLVWLSVKIKNILCSSRLSFKEIYMLSKLCLAKSEKLQQ